ncbi:MAG: TIGR00366 family protein [Steroidobacteraceae bacterium]
MTKPQEPLLTRVALRCCDFAERWFPDAFVFAAIAVAGVALAALLAGAPFTGVAGAFGDGFWSLIPFTMQMSLILMGGYIVASTPPIARLIAALACARAEHGPRRGVLGRVRRDGGLAAALGPELRARQPARPGARAPRRAAHGLPRGGRRLYLGAGSVWALGLSSSAAQLQANPASLPPALLKITGVIPFTETIFLWQSATMAVIVLCMGLLIAWSTAPDGAHARTAGDLGLVAAAPVVASKPPAGSIRPGERLEYAPWINLALVVLGAAWFAGEVSAKGLARAISSLNTYNLIFLMLGLLLSWYPRVFLDAAARSVNSIWGILIQFPLYGAIAGMLTNVTGGDGQTLAHHIAQLFTSIASKDSFPVVMGLYSAVLGFLVPSGGGKWVIEAPYVMQAANDLQVHLGWAVQIYNASEAMPNLINPFWMLPAMGILGLKARDLVGFTFLQLCVQLPLVLFLLWFFAGTLTYHAPVMP